MNTKYFSKEKKLFEQNNDEINYQYVGNGLVIGSKTLKFIVVDDFKKVNDVYGHDSGDIVLKRVSKIIN